MAFGTAGWHCFVPSAARPSLPPDSCADWVWGLPDDAQSTTPPRSWLASSLATGVLAVSDRRRDRHRRHCLDAPRPAGASVGRPGPRRARGRGRRRRTRLRRQGRRAAADRQRLHRPASRRRAAATLQPRPLPSSRSRPTPTLTLGQQLLRPDACAGASYAAQRRGRPACGRQGDAGRGVGVAVLDTGVAPVPDLSGRLIAGIDLSGEGNSLSDTFGHGTVMAGLIAGNGAASGGAYPGIAPERHDPVGQGRRRATVRPTSRRSSPACSGSAPSRRRTRHQGGQPGLGHARRTSRRWSTRSTSRVERLWSLGITVVVSAGNEGPGPGTITKPGDDPAVITVGAYDDNGTTDNSDDADARLLLPRSDGQRRRQARRGRARAARLVAVRSPGSTIEQQQPAGAGRRRLHPRQRHVGGHRRHGGRRRAAARPRTRRWTPDQVKYALIVDGSPDRRTSSRPTRAPARSGSAARRGASVGSAPVQDLQATGLGSLEASRGGQHVQVTCPGDTDADRGPAVRWTPCAATSPRTRGPRTAGPPTRGPQTRGPRTAGPPTAGPADSWTSDSWSSELVDLRQLDIEQLGPGTRSWRRAMTVAACRGSPW